jgi:hypothetical protein
MLAPGRPCSPGFPGMPYVAMPGAYVSLCILYETFIFLFSINFYDRIYLFSCSLTVIASWTGRYFLVGSYAHMCTPLPVVENLDVIEQIVFYFIYYIMLFTENEVRFLAYKKRP